MQPAENTVKRFYEELDEQYGENKKKFEGEFKTIKSRQSFIAKEIDYYNN